MIDLLVRDELIAAPRSSLNLPIGATRRIATVHVELKELQEIRSVLGGKVNDVVLCAATGGLRALLLERGEDPPRQGLRAMVPVNIRREGDDGELGNKVSSLFVELPVAEADPLRRYELVRAAAESRKAGGQALAAGAVIGLPSSRRRCFTRASRACSTPSGCSTSRSPTSPARRVACLRSARRWSTSCRSCRSRPSTRSGSRSISYAGGMTFGFCADRAAVPDLDVLRDGLADSLLELAALVPGRRRSRSRERGAPGGRPA